MSDYHFLTYNDFFLPYRISGNGPEMLLAFHGFGVDGSDFFGLTEFLGEQYTLYIFDLFYHGEKSISLEKELPPADPSIMAHLIEKLLWQNRRVKFSIVGYSMGGRISLCLLQKLPHRISEIFLIAPDGLKRALHEDFVTETLIGDYIYRRIIKNPNTLFALVKFLGSMKLLSQKMMQFILANLSDQQKRIRIYRTWKVFRNQKPDLKVVAHYLNTRKIRLELIFGKYDQIIKPVLAERLIRKLKHKPELHLLDSGHLLLSKAEQISKIILKG
ncbi:MAG: alpha/beta hydrolase [Bacteroidota bacterium]